MTRKRRIILFWICAVVCVGLAVPIILYSFGYRFSFSEWKILRAGGLFISSTPSTGTKIYVDDDLVKETSLLSRKIFLQGLTPRTYAVRIEKDGYFPWEKRLIVRPELVTDVEALLIKDGPEGEVIFRGNYVSLAFTDTSKQYIALKNTKGKTDYFDIARGGLIPQLPNTNATTTEEYSERAQEFLNAKKPSKFQYDAGGERIIWWDNDEIWIRWLRGEEFLPLFTENIEERVYQAPFLIRNAEFYPGKNAVLAAYSNAIMAIELDGRDKHNSYPLYKGREPIFVIEPATKTVYILDDGNLISVPLEE